MRHGSTTKTDTSRAAGSARPQRDCRREAAAEGLASNCGAVPGRLPMLRLEGREWPRRDGVGARGGSFSLEVCRVMTPGEAPGWRSQLQRRAAGGGAPCPPASSLWRPGTLKAEVAAPATCSSFADTGSPALYPKSNLTCAGTIVPAWEKIQKQTLDAQFWIFCYYGTRVTPPNSWREHGTPKVRFVACPEGGRLCVYMLIDRACDSCPLP